MRHRDLPIGLKLQIRSHFSYLWQRTSVWDEEEILVELPTFLRSEVTLHNNKAIVKDIRFLSALNAQCLAKVCLKLVLTRVAPGALVVREGESGNDSYFIASGAIILSVKIHEPVALDLDIDANMSFRTLSRGDSFSEYALVSVKSAKHPYTGKSLDSSEILVLSTLNFVALRDEFPAFEAAMCSLANARFKSTYQRLCHKSSLTAVKRQTVDESLQDEELAEAGSVRRKTCCWGACPRERGRRHASTGDLARDLNAADGHLDLKHMADVSRARVRATAKTQPAPC